MNFNFNSYTSTKFEFTNPGRESLSDDDQKFDHLLSSVSLSSSSFLYFLLNLYSPLYLFYYTTTTNWYCPSFIIFFVLFDLISSLSTIDSDVMRLSLNSNEFRLSNDYIIYILTLSSLSHTHIQRFPFIKLLLLFLLNVIRPKLILMMKLKSTKYTNSSPVSPYSLQLL